MSINWKTGEVDRDQHILQPEQLTLRVEDINYGNAYYVVNDALSADPGGGLWLDPEAIAYTEEDVERLKERIFFCRVVRVEEGYIVDASTGDFQLGPRSSDTVDVAPDVNFDEEGWEPAIALISSDPEREKLEELIFNQYSTVLNRSVLLPEPAESGEREGSEDEGSAT